MAAMRYRCPSTNDEVTTTIETGADTLFRMKTMNLNIWVACPHCVGGHQIRPAEAILPDERTTSAKPSRRAAAA